MRKALIIALIALLACQLFAGGSKEPAESTTPAAASTGVSITFLNSKGEIQAALEKIAKQYTRETGVKLDIIACGAGEVPYTKITTMYNSGNAPTLAMLDPTDIVSLGSYYALDLTDEDWVKENETTVTRFEDGKIYSFPFCVEGRGIIYNGDAISSVLGREFDPDSIKGYSDFAALLAEMRAKGMKYPVFIAMEDWSLGAHQLGFIYDAYDGTTEGADEVINLLKNGTDPLTIDRYNQFIETFNLLMEYNYGHLDPLGVDYDEGALLLAMGEVAFWPNGCWAWPNMEEGGAETDQDFGFLPFFLGDDPDDFANNGMQAAATKAVIIDRVQASAEQQQAAKDFLNWLVFNENGQKALVEDCAIIPASGNNPFPPLDPLGADIVAKMAAGKTYSSVAITPSDHWSTMGASMQKYLAGRSSAETLASELTSYWTKQK